MTNKRKIFNDPVYGFITIPSDLLFEIIEHPIFQRVRRIKQLGISELIYPAAVHSRFQHALGAMHLMTQALETLQSKGILIMDIEKEAAQIAILLHDVGHGPFSHVLEHTLFQNIKHEDISLFLLDKLNIEFNGCLSLAIEMFSGKYNRTFFHQLISSQLDMDRMDYLQRDSFFTGVAEGQIGVDRIIKMLNVINNQLVVEEKGLLSVENFLIARRLMYWQVYLHKTSICAETMLVLIFKRVRHLISLGIETNASPQLLYFLETNVNFEILNSDNKAIENFVLVDDIDIWHAIKSWSFHSDKILRELSSGLLNRKLFKVKIGSESEILKLTDDINISLKKKNIPFPDYQYYFNTGEISNSAYIHDSASIKMKMKNNTILDISEASDLPTIKALGNIVRKNYICYTKIVSLHLI